MRKERILALQDALHFIERIGTDSALRRLLRAGADRLDLEGLVALGRERGLDFTPEELVEAHARDTAMRWWHCAGEGRDQRLAGDEPDAAGAGSTATRS